MEAKVEMTFQKTKGYPLRFFCEKILGAHFIIDNSTYGYGSKKYIPDPGASSWFWRYRAVSTEKEVIFYICRYQNCAVEHKGIIWG